VDGFFAGLRAVSGVAWKIERAIALFALCTALGGCGPKAALLVAALPEGTMAVLLGHLQRLDETNRRRIAELDARSDWDGLARFAEENLTRAPSSAEWWLVAGYAHARAVRHLRAIECFSEAVRLAPDDMTGRYLLAESYRAAQQPQRAVLTLERALLVRRDEPLTWYLLAESYADLGRDSQAAAAYREALRLESGFAQAWFGLARAAARLGNAEELERARRALEQLAPALAAELARFAPAAR
jgi:predicted Zn-dependent protease